MVKESTLKAEDTILRYHVVHNNPWDSCASTVDDIPRPDRIPSATGSQW